MDIEAEATNSYYSKVIQDIENNRKRRLEGKLNCIPWPSFPKLCNKIPGIERETYTIVTANSKVGKTQLADFMYVLEPYKFIKENPNCGLKLKIIYFSLEISKSKKLLGLLANKIYNETGKVISSQNLNSKFSNYIIEEGLLDTIKQYRDYFNEFEKTVDIVDNIRNDFGIFKYVQDYMESNGRWVTKTIVWTDEKGNKSNRIVKDYYIPNDPEQVVIVITDSVNLLSPNKGQQLNDAMNKFSSDYCLYMRDKYKCCVVNIQQQSAAQEQQQYTNIGSSITSKLRPSADGLGDSKLTGRDANLIIGLFAPHRYEIPTHNGYDIKSLRDNYRELVVLLNRDGEGFFTDDLLFNGAVNYFAEAPDNRTKALSAEDYNNILRKIRRGER